MWTVINGGCDVGSPSVSGSMSKMRSKAAPLIVVPAALPLIVIGLVTSRSPVKERFSSVNELGEFGIVRLMVPAGRTIVSVPDPAEQSTQVAASLFALIIASRIEHAPLLESVSSREITVIVAAWAVE